MKLSLADWIGGAAIIGFVALLFLFFYSLFHSSPTFELQKDEWTCAKTEVRRRLMPILGGKALAPIDREVCVEYRRNP